jgi:hypothetical protein
VKGATLATTLGAAAPGAAGPGRAPAVGGIAAGPGPADAEQVRAELDEFEAAIQQAHRDTAAGTVHGRDGDRYGIPFDRNDNRHDNRNDNRYDSDGRRPGSTPSTPSTHQTGSTEGIEE